MPAGTGNSVISKKEENTMLMFLYIKFLEY